MNWTGGRLQRHSTAKSSAAQRQKQHFARVKQNLCSRGSAIKTSPNHIPGFESRDRRQRPRGQSVLSRTTSVSREKSQPNQRHNVSELRHSHSAQRPTSNYSSRLHIPFSDRTPLPALVEREQSHVPDDDLYNATPQPRMLKRGRGASQPLSEISQEQKEESLSEKKRRILRKGDWLGITIQKPLKLAFTSPRDEQRIGKRRKVSKEHRANILSAQSRNVSPFAARPRRNNTLRADSQQLEGNRPPAPDVRISIGGRALQPGVSSSIAPLKKSTPSIAGRRSSQVPSSSDIMLLDQESVRGYQLGRESNGSLSRILGSRRPNLRSLEQASENSGISGREHLSGHVSMGSDNQGWVRMTEESLERPQSKFQGHKGKLVGEPAPPPLATPRADFRQDLVPGEVFFSSSSASIHHPKPQSSQRSILLRSSSSEVISSNIAQIGMANTIVSSPQALQNEIWRTWIATEDDSDDPRTNTNCSELPSGNGWINPGISIPLPRRSNKKMPAKDRSSSELEEPDTENIDDLEQGKDLQQSYEKTSAYEYEDNRVFPIEKSRPGGTSSQLGQISEDESEISERQASDIEVVGTLFPVDNRTMSHPITRAAQIETDAPLVGKEIIEEPNDVWRKFVFGSSSDGVKTPCSGLTVNTTYSDNMPLADSSIVAHQAVEYSQGLHRIGGKLHDFTIPGQSCVSKASYFTDSSSLPAASRSWSSRLHTENRQASIHDSREPVAASTSDNAPPARGIDESSQSVMSYPGSAPYVNTQREKFLFTKPKPFVGKKILTNIGLEDETVYIGRGFRDQDKRIQVKSGELGQRDAHGLVGSDEELESIEDD
ncbi:hypothetical protein BUE80_DR008757 [Diplocarpon rosae]|nr:hypothetical protein BUE80_DR008757 [Diplocarpon rosae]